MAYREYVGEVNDNNKSDFLGRAKALLFPIDWPEPFGLVTIEAMACGTPVIASHLGPFLKPYLTAKQDLL